MRYGEICEFEIDDANHVNLEILDQIISECGEAIAQMRQSKRLLFRGARNTEMIYRDRPRTDRRPRDTNPLLHYAIDDWLKEHGFAALRSNSLFVTPLKGMTEQYGNTYAIFPVDGFSYTWFQGGSGDLFLDIQNHFTSAMNGGTPEFHKDVAERLMAMAKPTSTNLTSAIRKGHEIMIAGADYYAVDYSRCSTMLRQYILGLKK